MFFPADPAPAHPAPLRAADYARLKPLQRACADSQALGAALASGMDPNQHFDFNHESRPLFVAVRAYQPQGVLALLRAGADPNVDDGRGDPLFAALSLAHNGPDAFACALHLANAKHLKADPERPVLGMLRAAPALAPALAARGFSPNAMGPRQTVGAGLEGRPTCLGMAFLIDGFNVLAHAQALLNVGADPNGGDGAVSPLACAIACQSRPDAIELLLRAGANPLAPWPSGGSCHEAAQRARDERPNERSQAIAELVDAWAQRRLLDAIASMAPSGSRPGL